MFTIITDKDGTQHIVSKSDKDTASAIRRIAAATIKAYRLNCTVDEYLAEVEKRRNDRQNTEN